MKNYSIIIFFLTNICLGQVNDDFNDGDFINWSGTTSHFIVNASHQLQLNNTVASTSYLTTSFAPTQNDLEWNVYAKQSFAGSGANYGRVYLLSDQANLATSLNGYFLQLGEAGSNDAVELFRQTGNTAVSVCRAANATIASSFAMRIKVTRIEGRWTVLIDYTGGTSYAEAAAGVDSTYSSGQWMGIVCVYTIGNANKFFFDDFYAGPPRPDPLPPDVAVYNDIVINEFLPDPTPPVGLPEQEFVEIYNRSSKTFDLNGWKIGDASGMMLMPPATIHPGEYVVITSGPSLNNSGDIIRIVDNHGLLIDSISYTLAWYQDDLKSGGGYSIERLNPDVASNDITNWYVSLSVTGGTPGGINSVFGRNPDSKPPLIINIRLLVDVIVIKFSEPVTGPDIGGFPTEYRADTTALIHLVNLTNGLNYSMTIDKIADLASNPLAPTEYSFTYFIPHTVFHKDVIITEIMADPTPVVQMPEGEYIELFNRSANPVDLSGWRIEDPTTSGKLPSHILMPGEYLVFTSATNASKFQKAIGVQSFPSLGNLGDRIVLRKPGGLSIDSVAYGLSWYRNSEKAEGGWSLELIDINNPCGEGDNWTASEDIDGGTPGEINSVFANKPDVTAPKLLNVFAVAADSLLFTFDERPFVTGSYSMTGKAFIRDKSIVLLLSKKLQTKTSYSITVKDVSDCNGNRIEPTTFSFALTESAERNDVVINEVLFNPRPVEFDFVEIYNRSLKYVDLKNWKLSGKVITATNEVMAPGDYRVLSSISMSMPSMPDDEGDVTFVSQRGDTIDHFHYSDKMHSAILSDTEGVSLERINPGESNWHSGNASTGYSTPGYLNSNSRPLYTADEGTISIVPEVINSPAVPFAQIYYHFDRGGFTVNASVVDTDGRVIKTIASNETIGTEGSFIWNGDRDEGGAAPSGYYVLWFQAFDPDGVVRTYRRRVVVGL